jgi:uncharacterized membrane protein YhhN
MCPKNWAVPNKIHSGASVLIGFYNEFAFLHLMITLGAVLAALYLLKYCWQGPSAIKTWVKTLSIALPALGLTWSGAPLLPLMGLWACALGDALLSRDGDKMLQGGIASFAVGHIFYVVAFIVHFSPSIAQDPVALTVLIPLMLILLGLSTEWWLQPFTGDLRGPVRCYVGLILPMGCVAAQQPIPQTTVFWGAMAFILSDLVLSVQIFRRLAGVFERLASYAIWFFYYIAQVLIFYGFIA